MAGWMDSAMLAEAGIPSVIIGPSGEGLHADVEWVDLGSVAQCHEVVLATAREFCR
jgi:acetylornithine deacetylase